VVFQKNLYLPSERVFNFVAMLYEYPTLNPSKSK
jgi:hypothetical protein